MSLREESSEQWSVTDRGEVNRLSVVLFLASDGTFWRLYCRVFSYLVSRYMSSPNFFFLFFFFKGRWGVRSDFSRGQLDMWGDAPLCPSALPSPSPLWILFTNASAGFSKRGLMGLLVTKKNALELQESQISQALVCAVLYKWWQMSFLDRQTDMLLTAQLFAPQDVTKECSGRLVPWRIWSNPSRTVLGGAPWPMLGLVRSPTPATSTGRPLISWSTSTGDDEDDLVSAQNIIKTLRVLSDYYAVSCLSCLSGVLGSHLVLDMLSLSVVAPVSVL